MSRPSITTLAILFLAFICNGCGSQTAPSSVTLTATPTTIAPGGTTTLSWTEIAGATSCAIDNGVGAVPCTASSKIVTPSVTTTYTLTATGSGTSGNTTSTAIVTVSSVTTPTVVGITPVTPIMGTFTATPTTVPAGGTTTLSWKGILKADHCLIDNNVGLVPCSDGSILVTLPATTPDAGPVVTYTFWAIGIEASVSATVDITVTPR
jgi:hypothetical protein